MRHAALAAEVGRVVAAIRAAGLDPADRAAIAQGDRGHGLAGGALRPAIFRALDGRPYADLL